MDHNARLCKGMDTKLYKASKSVFSKLVLNEDTVKVFEEVTPAEDTALHTAAFYGSHLQARKLIRLALANPEAGKQFLRAQNTEGETALHVAAKRGYEKIVKELVKKERDVACVKNKAGETALFKACEKGHVVIVECLLECTPESEEVDARADGQSLLHVAVANGHTGVTAKLIEKRGEIIEKADDLGRTALHILALVPVIKSFGSWWSTTQAIAKMLLGKEKSLMYRVDVNGQSALHYGAKVGNDHLVKVILSYGTDCIQISDNDGRTALHLAVENASQVYNRVGHYPLRYIIPPLTLSRLIDCSDKRGQTALDIAIQKTPEDQQLFSTIKRYLIRNGASEKMFKTETREDSAPSALQQSPNIISVNAVLIATVAFAAAFTLPGNIDTNANPPVPFLLHVPVFKLFVIFDSLAFCISVGSAVLLCYAEEDRNLPAFCSAGVWVALTCIALAFGAAIHLVVAHKCLWLAGLVWIMVCYLPLQLRLFSIPGKANMFMEPRQIWKVLSLPAVLIIIIFTVPFGTQTVFGAAVFCVLTLLSILVLNWIMKTKIVAFCRE